MDSKQQSCSPADCGRATNQVQRPKVRAGTEFRNSLPQCIRQPQLFQQSSISTFSSGSSEGTTTTDPNENDPAPAYTGSGYVPTMFQIDQDMLATMQQQLARQEELINRLSAQAQQASSTPIAAAVPVSQPSADERPSTCNIPAKLSRCLSLLVIPCSLRVRLALTLALALALAAASTGLGGTPSFPRLLELRFNRCSRCSFRCCHRAILIRD